MRYCERNAVTRSRVKRLPCPVLTPLRLSTPAITSSLRDQRQCAHRFDHVGGRAGALAASATRQAMLGVGAADPMQGEHDLGPRLVEVGDRLVD